MKILEKNKEYGVKSLLPGSDSPEEPVTSLQLTKVSR